MPENNKNSGLYMKNDILGPGGSTLTDADLARLEELAGKATPGKWSTTDYTGPDVLITAMLEGIPYSVWNCGTNARKEDLEYIAAACNAAPALVAEVRRLREDNAGLVSTMKTAVMCGRAIENENAALRSELEQMEHGMTAAYMFGRADEGDLQAENATLRERVEALERLVGAHDNYLTMADNIAEFGKTPENLENLQAAYDRRAPAREAIK